MQLKDSALVIPWIANVVPKTPYCPQVRMNFGIISHKNVRNLYLIIMLLVCSSL